VNSSPFEAGEFSPCVTNSLLSPSLKVPLLHCLMEHFLLSSLTALLLDPQATAEMLRILRCLVHEPLHEPRPPSECAAARHSEEAEAARHRGRHRRAHGPSEDATGGDGHGHGSSLCDHAIATEDVFRRTAALLLRADATATATVDSKAARAAAGSATGGFGRGRSGSRSSLGGREAIGEDLDVEAELNGASSTDLFGEAAEAASGSSAEAAAEVAARRRFATLSDGAGGPRLPPFDALGHERFGAGHQGVGRGESLYGAADRMARVREARRAAGAIAKVSASAAQAHRPNVGGGIGGGSGGGSLSRLPSVFEGKRSPPTSPLSSVPSPPSLSPSLSPSSAASNERPTSPWGQCFGKPAQSARQEHGPCASFRSVVVVRG
jgi:hypothetical protein